MGRHALLGMPWGWVLVMPAAVVSGTAYLACPSGLSPLRGERLVSLSPSERLTP
ncbi:MAG: hypothetical protein IPL93_15210 [Actinomycetales bacterium]|nr:hypothetical protein [Actinomycetales bacterium]